MLARNPDRSELRYLHEANLLIILDPEGFPYDSFSKAVRDVPLVLVEEDHALPAACLEWIGPFDRIAISESEPAPDLEEARILRTRTDDLPALMRRISETDISGARLRKTRHRVDSEAVQFVLDSSEKGERLSRVLTISSDDGPPLLLDGSHEQTVVPVRDLSSSAFSDESFDALVGIGLLQSDSRGEIAADMWRAVRPGGKILLVDQFVFDRESRERFSKPPASVSEYTCDILRATDGRVTLDFMRSLRYPPDEIHRAAVFALRRL